MRHTEARVTFTVYDGPTVRLHWGESCATIYASDRAWLYHPAPGRVRRRYTATWRLHVISRARRPDGRRYVLWNDGRKKKKKWHCFKITASLIARLTREERRTGSFVWFVFFYFSEEKGHNIYRHAVGGHRVRTRAFLSGSRVKLVVKPTENLGSPSCVLRVCSTNIPIKVNIISLKFLSD